MDLLPLAAVRNGFLTPFPPQNRTTPPAAPAPSLKRREVAFPLLPEEGPDDPVVSCFLPTDDNAKMLVSARPAPVAGVASKKEKSS